MILIDEILVSREVAEKKFVCQLSACKGACCIDGDYGAPLEDEEVQIIADSLEKIIPYIPEASVQRIQDKGFHKKRRSEDQDETALMKDGACVFMGRDKSGTSYCGIEKAHRAGDIDFKKPVSCHLYPIRVVKNKHTGFEALNYDEWDICSAACGYGEELGVRVYEFARDAIVRKYGEAFYDALDHAVKHLSED